MVVLAQCLLNLATILLTMQVQTVAGLLVLGVLVFLVMQVQHHLQVQLHLLALFQTVVLMVTAIGLSLVLTHQVVLTAIFGIRSNYGTERLR